MGWRSVCWAWWCPPPVRCANLPVWGLPVRRGKELEIVAEALTPHRALWRWCPSPRSSTGTSSAFSEPMDVDSLEITRVDGGGGPIAVPVIGGRQGLPSWWRCGARDAVGLDGRVGPPRCAIDFRRAPGPEGRAVGPNRHRPVRRAFQGGRQRPDGQPRPRHPLSRLPVSTESMMITLAALWTSSAGRTRCRGDATAGGRRHRAACTAHRLCPSLCRDDAPGHHLVAVSPMLTSAPPGVPGSRPAHQHGLSAHAGTSTSWVDQRAAARRVGGPVPAHRCRQLLHGLSLATLVDIGAACACSWASPARSPRSSNLRTTESSCN